MNSFNHYAYGAIGEWLYTYVAGLKIDAERPGYEHTIFHPHPGSGLTNAKATFSSLYGQLTSAWEIKDGNFIYKVEIPANTTGTIRLPKAKITEVKMNNTLLNSTKIGNIRQSENEVVNICLNIHLMNSLKTLCLLRALLLTEKR